MKLKMKKTASLLLAAVTAFSMLPMAASAAATEKERNSEAAEESLIVSNKTETCHSLSEEWFGDGESSLCKSLKSEKKGLSLALDSYFAEREASFTTRTVYTTKGNHASMSNAVKAESEKRIEGINTLEANVNIKITDAEVTTLYDNDHIIFNKDGSVTVYVYEWTFFDYDDLTDKAQNIDVSGFGVYHKITLVPEGKTYRIQSDEYNATDGLGICTINESTRQELAEMKWEPVDTDSDIFCELVQAERGVEYPDLDEKFYEKYDPKGCADYADKYVKNSTQSIQGGQYTGFYNSAAYHYFDNNDCTNYASQCIHAGGMPMVTGNNGWYYNTNTHESSSAWRIVEYNTRWMENNRGVKVKASDTNIYKGSPVYYGTEHTVICVGKNSSNRPIINSHTGDWYHAVWTYMNSESITTVQLTPYDPVLNPFVDVKPTDFFYNPVIWAVENGITGGTDSTHFSPNRTVQRCDLMVFIWAAMGRPEHNIKKGPVTDDFISNPFVDVKPGDWYYDAVMWAYENGYAAGVDATHFKPKATCDRSMALQFLYAVAGKPYVYWSENPYSDVTYNDWYWKSATWAYKFGLESGEMGPARGGNRIFNATTPCTRAYAITYLYRLLGKQ